MISPLRFLSIVLLLAGMTWFASSCSDKINREDMYTFTGQTVMDYIDSNPDLSMFAKVLRISHNSARANSSAVSALLGTRGNFAVFAPTNDAMKLYLDSVYGNADYDVDTMSRERADKIVLNSVIDYDWETAPSQVQMTEGSMQQGTLNDSHLILRFGDWGDNAILKINNRSRVIRGDIEVENGKVHIVDRVITPGPTTLPGLMGQVDNLRIFCYLMNITSWADSMTRYEDKVYNDSTYKYDIRYRDDYSYFPRYRTFGYTAFVETDDVFQSDWGVPKPVIDKESGRIENINEIMGVIEAKCREAYPDAKSANPEDMDNAVNQFVSYHLVKMKFSYKNLAPRVNDYGYYNFEAKYHNIEQGVRYNGHLYYPDSTDVWEYCETMGKPNRMFKVTNVAMTNEKRINRHCTYDNSYYGTMQETSCDRKGILVHKDNLPYDNYAPNGYYYPIDHVLVYDKDVPRVVLNERIRYHLMWSLGEIINLDLNPNININYSFRVKRFTPDYCEDLKTNGYIQLGHGVAANQTLSWFKMAAFQFLGTEVWVKLWHVPYAGKWEIRFSHMRGLIHMKFGDTTNENLMKDLGIRDYTAQKMLEAHHGRLEFWKESDNSGRICWADSTEAIEADKRMRQLGLKYLPYVYGSYPDITCRWFPARLVHARPLYNQMFMIISQEYMEPDKDYYVLVRSLLPALVTPFNKDWTDGSFWDANAIELVPENVYNNPNRAEDWW